MNRFQLACCTILTASLLLASTVVVLAADPPKPDAKPADAKAPLIPVAILDFESKDPGSPELGKQIGEALIAILTGEQGFKLVDRTTISRVIQEHEMNLTGLADTDQAIKVGKLVGAKIIVTGKAFMLGQKLYITAKLIGTETSLVEGVLVKGDSTAKIDELVVQLAGDLSQRLRDSGPKLIAGEDEADPVPALKAKLAMKKHPTVAVIITEEHHGAAVRQAVDPAVETEIKILLTNCGIKVQDVTQNDLADWARLIDKEHVDNWPRGLGGVDYVVTGKGFSEFGARVGNLISCAARAEINVINHSDGKILLADRATTRDVDLSENIAGKKALQKAGRQLGIRILEEFAKTLPAADEKK